MTTVKVWSNEQKWITCIQNSGQTGRIDIIKFKHVFPNASIIIFSFANGQSKLILKKNINDKTLVAAKLCSHKARSKSYGHIVLSSNIIKKNSFQFSYLVTSSLKNGQF